MVPMLDLFYCWKHAFTGHNFLSGGGAVDDRICMTRLHVTTTRSYQLLGMTPVVVIETGIGVL
jgi:hypothetical protein